MRRPFLWALLAVAAGAVLLGRPSNPAAPLSSRPPGGAALSAPTPRTSGPIALPQAPRRNVFRYQDQEATTLAAGWPLAPVATSLPPALLPSPPPPVRLVGILKRGDRTCAALWIAGEVVVLAVGEEAEGYRLLGLSEADGVQLRGLSGEVLTLGPPGE